MTAAAIAVALGTALGDGRPSLARVATVALVLGCAGAWAVRRTRWVMWMAVVVLGLAAVASSAWRAVGDEQRVLPTLVGEDGVEVCGGVRKARPRSVEVAVSSVGADGRRWRTAEPARVGAPEVTRHRPGARICATGRVVPPRPGYDEAPLLSAEEAAPEGIASPIRHAASVVRSRFSDAASAELPDRQAGLLLGMTDGDVALLDDETMEAFRVTGLAHLVAVSGSNVAVVLAVVLLLARYVVPGGRWVRALVAVPPLVFFAFLTALEPSVLRATASAAVVLAVTSGGGRPEAHRVAAVAFVVLVLVSPDLLFHPGFQLSFGATLGLIWWSRPLTERLLALTPWTGRVATVCAAAFGTTLAAQFAVAPLLAWHFGQIPAVGGVANLIVAPLAPVVMIGGMVTLTAASLWSALGWLPATMRLILDLILWVADAFSRLPAASLEVSLAASVALTAGLFAVAADARRQRWLAVALLVASTAVAGGQTLVARATDCEHEVRALDVGQGTAVLVRSGAHRILVDAGPAAGAVHGALSDAGGGRLDAVFLTHPDADHIGGMPAVLATADVDRMIGSVNLHWGAGQALIDEALTDGVTVARAHAGDRFTFGDRLRVDVVSPPSGPAPRESEEGRNAYGLVLEADLAGVRVLFPADTGADEQRRLAVSDTTVLIAPHHGSKDIHPPFIRDASPEVTIVTVGENRYGHPTDEAMALYREFGPLFRTDRHGWVAVCVSGGGLRVTTEHDHADPVR